MPDPILIGGEWRPGGGDEIVSIYPADQSVSGSVAGADKDACFGNDRKIAGRW